MNCLSSEFAKRIKSSIRFPVCTRWDPVLNFPHLESHLLDQRDSVLSRDWIIFTVSYLIGNPWWIVIDRCIDHCTVFFVSNNKTTLFFFESEIYLITCIILEIVDFLPRPSQCHAWHLHFAVLEIGVAFVLLITPWKLELLDLVLLHLLCHRARHPHVRVSSSSFLRLLRDRPSADRDIIGRSTDHVLITHLIPVLKKKDKGSRTNTLSNAHHGFQTHHVRPVRCHRGICHPRPRPRRDLPSRV